MFILGFVRVFEYAIAFLFLVVLVVFAASNRALIELNLFPLPFVIDLPVYLALISVLFIGVFLGGFAGFAYSFGGRLALRSMIRQKRELDKQLILSGTNNGVSPSPHSKG